jgi:ornithine cyclodeaminase/alanine dehydrogenase-like protein (mu-crystallin family)
MLLLNETDLRAALDMRTCIAAMERAFIDLANDAYFNPLRARVKQDDASPNWMTFMPSMRAKGTRRWALKQMVVCPANRKVGMDPLQGSVILQDGDNGRLLAIADAPSLTEIRTAAVSGLATRTLANKDAKSIAIIGVGIQARAHVVAMKTVLPNATIRAWGRTPDKARKFAQANGIELAGSLEAAVREADVICTVTSTTDPIIRREWIKPGCHLNAVGSSRSTHVELFPETVAAASLFVDRREAALKESGDVLGALKAGLITPEHIQAELGEVLAGRHPGRRSASEFTLYKSLGLGTQDLAAIEAAVESARKLGRGVEVDW